MPRPLQVFVQFFVLGLTSFGGPVAHLSYFTSALCSGSVGSPLRPTPIWLGSVSCCRALRVPRWAWVWGLSLIHISEPTRPY